MTIAAGRPNGQTLNATWRGVVSSRYALALGASPPLEQWDAVIAPSVPDGPALLGFVAARIAEEHRRLLRRTRRQTAWLVERLGLRDAAAS